MLLTALLLGCPKPTTPPTTPVSSTARVSTSPPLVVVIVVDQLSMRLLEKPRERYTAGLAKLLGPEAAVRTAHYSHAITYTCPGHATISTGAAPSVSGIVSNDWWLQAPDGSGERVYCADTALLRVGTLADRVVESGGAVASVALKDRSASMLGGTNAGLTSWYDRKQRDFTAPLTGAVDLTPYQGTWTALFPEDYARWVGPDAGPRERDAGTGVTFPHPPSPMEDFLDTAMSGDALVDAALVAADRLQLGKGGPADLLMISFSQIDYIGHTYTTESWEAMDAMVRLDLSIGRLLDGLEERAEGELLVVLTADHGSTIAEGAVRIPLNAVKNAANGALADLKITGAVHVQSPSLWLPQIDDPELRKKATLAVKDAVAAIPGIEDAFAWRLEPIVSPHLDAITQSLDDERSGDIYVLRGKDALYDYQGAEGKGTSHGTPYPHDTDVPFLAWGAGVKPGPHPMVDVRQIAPTLSTAMSLPPPSGATEAAVDGFRGPAKNPE